MIYLDNLFSKGSHNIYARREMEEFLVECVIIFPAREKYIFFLDIGGPLKFYPRNRESKGNTTFFIRYVGEFNQNPPPHPHINIDQSQA